MTRSRGEPDANVIALAAQGRKIQAIKAYRAKTGARLAEAKAVVEGLDLSGAHHAASADGAAPTPILDEGPNGALVLAVTVLSAFASLLLGTGVVRTAMTNDWIETEAVVMSARIERGNDTSPTVAIEYRYEVDHVEYVSDRIAYAQTWGPWFTDQTFSRYPAKSHVSAWYDPDAPANAVLRRRVPIPYYASLFVAAGALAWGLSSWRELIRRERESGSRPLG